ncbi:MAG: hypothetical protein OQJ78_07530 [Ignavibacteriaceae bacterium]|nr:hypothetical protein [Ignavibacteriaceae bacterium]
MIVISISIYPQQNREQALRKGGWTGGLAGWVGWENFKTSNKIDDVNYDSKIDGYNFIISSRNGSLVENNGVFGFDFQWRQKDRTTKPDPNPNNANESLNEKEWFLGLWARYYIPLAGELAMYFEGSGGYAVFSKNYEIIYGQNAGYNYNEYADGFAYNAGVGFSLFVSPNAAFEITGRWEGGSLSGSRDIQPAGSSELNVERGNIYILFGFQVYLR